MQLDPCPPWHGQQRLVEKLLCVCTPSKSSGRTLACQQVIHKVKGREEPALGLAWGEMSLLQTKPSSKRAQGDIMIDGICHRLDGECQLIHSGAKLKTFYVFSID